MPGMTATRAGDVLQRQVADELLLLVPGSDEAHALNAGAAAVYALCDGGHAKPEMAGAVQRRTGLPADEAVVDLALAELAEAGLVRLDAAAAVSAPSRLGVARRLRLSPAQLRRLPAVETVLLPPAARAAEQPVRRPDVSFVPIADDAIDDMLAMAHIGPGDLVCELGCGDARLLVAAATRHGCRGLGVDVDPLRVAEARDNVRRAGLADRVRIEEADMFQLDLGEVDVLLLYILPTLNARLLPQLAGLRPGSRVVSHDFDLPGVVPDRALQVYSPTTQYAKTFFLWVAPLKHAAQHPVRRQWAQSSRIA